MEINFDYNGEILSYQCLDVKEKVDDILRKCRNNIDINSIIYLYSGNPIDGTLSICKIVNKIDNERKKMTILVKEKKVELNNCFINSKDIICPKCGECAKFDISEYKLLFQCRKGHNIGNIFLNEYENTQKIDLSKIICDECKNNNKANSYKNIFYRCNQCKINLCIQCYSKHKNKNKDHSYINYDDKNYICDIHNEKYSSYCNKCNKNICLYCKNDHKEHETINYENILPNLYSVKNNLEN